MTGHDVQRNKAVVGENAFAHEAGIHQHGMLGHRETYEIMRPEDIGIPASKLVLGKHSGRHAFKQRTEALGYSLTDEQIDQAFEKFKALADKKKEVFDEDIEALIDEQIEHVAGGLDAGGRADDGRLQGHPHGHGHAGKGRPDSSPTPPSATGPWMRSTRPSGGSPASQPRLTDYALRALTCGKDAQGEVTIEVEHEGRRFRARGVSTDIVEASARAYLAAVNRAATWTNDAGGKPRPPQP